MSNQIGTLLSRLTDQRLIFVLLLVSLLIQGVLAWEARASADHLLAQQAATLAKGCKTP